MTNSGWREKLMKHPLCKRLKESNAKDSSHKQHSDSKSHICVFGSDLYTWDTSEKQILHCNLKRDYENETQQSSPSIANLGAFDVAEERQKYQRLILNSGFSLDVESISVNRCGSHIVVWGAQVVRVVELPRRWGKNAMFEGGKESVSCRTICIGQRTFNGNSSLRIRQVSWHPGSKTDSHLALLTSDNMFSVYDIQEPDEPLNVININTGDVSVTFSPSKSLVGPALGETGVAFDFGSAVTLKPEKPPLNRPQKLKEVEAWPVYCVRGNGDVMLLHSHLLQFSHVKVTVQGPLMMYPPAEDNYGVDACSILCLPTPFPVVVISTCEGRVHHCVQLPGTSDDESLPSNAHDLSLDSHPSGGNYQALNEPVLYVIETAELELCLSLPRFDGEAPLEDDFMCPVRLKKDGGSHDRYHCAHAAGVHSVALPWLNTVQQYFLDESGDFNMPEEKECVVEHIVCTKPLHSCPTAPIIGMDVVTDPLLGPTLLILSSDYEFTALPIGLQYQIGVSKLGEDDDSDVKVMSPLRRHAREPFSQQIAQLLQRKASNPLLKASSNSELSQQDCFQLLSRATQVLREEYIQKQDHARQEIDTRIAILREHKEQQLQDIKSLIDSRHMLREHAGSFAERLETSKENHEKLLKRLESIIHKIQNQLPTLSEAEKQMVKELNKIKENAKLYQENIDQVHVKQEYQERQIAKSAPSPGPSFQRKQLTQIHGVLKEEAEDIEDLKKDISRLNLSLS